MVPQRQERVALHRPHVAELVGHAAPCELARQLLLGVQGAHHAEHHERDLPQEAGVVVMQRLVDVVPVAVRDQAVLRTVPQRLPAAADPGLLEFVDPVSRGLLAQQLHVDEGEVPDDLGRPVPVVVQPQHLPAHVRPPRGLRAGRRADQQHKR